MVLEDVLPALRDDNGDRAARTALMQCLSSESRSEGLVLVFLEPPERESCLPSILADQFARLEVPYPRGQELENIAREEVAFLMHRSGAEVDVERAYCEARELAPGLAGLTRSAARDALRDAMGAGGSLDYRGARARLDDRKRRALRRELAMNVLDAEEAEMPVGLDYLVEYLTVFKGRLSLYGNGRARGVLLIGPPGTGKTMLARAIGKLVNLPVVEFRISSLMNSLLGETERRFARAFVTLEAMSPNVVFIDEIEKAFGDSSERDGGTMMRCTGALLSWLADNSYPNFVVATSNSLTRMGEIGLTMTRSERFDAAFFVDLPGKDARYEMLRRWLKGALDDPEPVAAELADQTRLFSGADLFSAVKQARGWAEHQGRAVSAEDVRAQIRRKRSRAEALYQEFDALRRWGRVFCDPAGPTED
ncbi:MAG: ATP-binding protein [Deltaproteobacteria bacterium]|nr:ATP-binding protein [Deltaproteobacteria bacterium]